MTTPRPGSDAAAARAIAADAIRTEHARGSTGLDALLDADGALARRVARAVAIHGRFGMVTYREALAHGLVEARILRLYRSRARARR